MDRLFFLTSEHNFQTNNKNTTKEENEPEIQQEPSDWKRVTFLFSLKLIQKSLVFILLHYNFENLHITSRFPPLVDIVCKLKSQSF